MISKRGGTSVSWVKNQPSNGQGMARKNIMEIDRKKALIVEDTIQIQDVIVAVLQDKGFITYTAGDGNAGLELLEKHNDIDIIITDIFMPQKEGIGFIRGVRQKYPTKKIMVITGAVNFDTISKTAYDFGANLTMKKPLNLDEFTCNIDHLILT